MGLRKDRVGEVNYTSDGKKLTIIAYRNNADLDIKIEDDIVIKNIRYTAFKNGNMLTLLRRIRVGEVGYNNNGQKMTIIAYRNFEDIDVQFEDGNIAYHKRYDNFKKGKIANKNSRVGDVCYNSKGQKMTIIRYGNCNDIDVKFEDGTVAINKTYKNFTSGNICKPSIRVGELRVNSIGILMELIEYVDCKSIKIRFEDGSVCTSDYNSFSKGVIGHPTLRMSGISLCKGSTFGLFDVKKFMYRTDNKRDVNYLCQCRKCGYKDILTPTEMLNHKC